MERGLLCGLRLRLRLPERIGLLLFEQPAALLVHRTQIVVRNYVALRCGLDIQLYSLRLSLKTEKIKRCKTL